MTIYLVDATYELFRAFYGRPRRSDEGEKNVGAVQGLVRSLLKLIKENSVTHLACAFDHTIESFRNDLYPGYKTAEGIDPAILAQFGLAEEAVRCLGIVVWPMVQFEADDALATAADRWAEKAEQIVICSPDKDLSQCIQGDRVVCLDRRRNIILDERGVVEKYGVLPESIPDWLALCGDSADGFPGVPGWGRKSSATVLRKFHHLEKIPGDAAEWKTNLRGESRLHNELRNHWQSALLFRQLATLRTDVPIQESLEDLKWKGLEKSQLHKLARLLGDRDLEGYSLSSPEQKG